MSHGYYGRLCSLDSLLDLALDQDAETLVEGVSSSAGAQEVMPICTSRCLAILRPLLATSHLGG